MSEAAALIQFQRASRWYGPVIALNDVTTTLGPGVTGLLGPNGAGKSTFLKLCAGQLAPSQGTVTVLGVPAWGHPELFHRLGLCPEADALWDQLTGAQFLTALLRLSGFEEAECARRAQAALETVDLMGARQRRCGGYSRGMRQRLKLAQALAHDPQVLLLDEPASGLDPRARVELRELLRELRNLGKTILISSHILPELEELCTSVAIVDRGQVLAQGRVADIERRLRFGAVLRVRLLLEGEALEDARDRFAADPDVASATILDDGTVELGFRGDDAASARLLAASVTAGMPIANFSRAASDLEELFLQVTAPDREPSAAA